MRSRTTTKKRSFAIAISLFILLITLSICYAQEEKISVIITLKEPDQAMPEAQKQAGISSLRSNPEGVIDSMSSSAEIVRNLSSIHSFSAVISADDMAMIKEHPLVESVAIDRNVYALMAQSIPLVEADKAWNISIDSNYLRGQGVSICVIDTGVDKNHPALSSRIIAEKCFCSDGDGCCPNSTEEPISYSIESDLAPDDHKSGHGTHVIGTLISQDTTYRGIAPDARVVAVKVLDSEGVGKDSDVLAAIEWCRAHKHDYNISVISLSIGRDDFGGHCDDTDNSTRNYHQVISDAVEDGIAVVAASGNDGMNYALALPACLSNVISVGATYDHESNASDGCTDQTITPDMMTCFTNIDNTPVRPLIFAPGAVITSTVPLSVNPFGFGDMSGTSMAAPHVAGTAAIIIQAHRIKHNSTPSQEQIISALLESSDEVNALRAQVIWDDPNASFRRLNAYDSAISIADTQGPDIEYVQPTPADGACVQDVSWMINATVEDGYSDVVGCSLIITLANTTSYTYTMELEGKGRTAICSIRWPIPGAGNYSYHITAADALNNTASSQTRTITLNNSAPVITDHTPETSFRIELTRPQTHWFSFTAYDANNDSLQVSWLLEKSNQSVVVQISNSSGTATSQQHTYSLLFETDGFIDGNYTLKAIVSDQELDDSLSWNITIKEESTQLMQIADIAGQWWYMTTNMTLPLKNSVMLNLSDYFEGIANNCSYALDTSQNITKETNGTIIILSSAHGWKGTVNCTVEVTCQNVTVTSNTFILWVTDDHDGDGHAHHLLGGTDCDDSDPEKYTGAPCVRDGYTGSTLDSGCVCSGGTRITRSSGGGSAGSIAIYHDPNQESAYLASIPQESLTTVAFKQDAIPVSSLSFITNKDLRGVRVVLTRIEETSELEEIFRDLYAAFWVSLYSMSDEDLEKAIITFKVDRSWLENGEIKTIVLNRKEESGWRALQSVYSHEDEAYHYFDAVSPGFSLFAIEGAADDDKAKEEEHGDMAQKSYASDNASTDEEITGIADTKDITEHGPEQEDQAEFDELKELERAPMLQYPFVSERALYAIPMPQLREDEKIAGFTKDFLFGLSISIAVFFFILYYVFRGEDEFRRLEELERYIRLKMQQGMDEQKIVIELRRLGWEQEIISYHISSVKVMQNLSELEKYIRMRFAQGDLEDEIHDDLLAMGWKERYVRYAIENIGKEISYEISKKRKYAKKRKVSSKGHLAKHSR